MRRALSAILTLAAAACTSDLPAGGGTLLEAPTNLTYRLEPSGVAGEPLGIVLSWDVPDDPAVQRWNVYSRRSTTAPFDLRATTTSPSFHDRGIPDLDYRVTAVDAGGFESVPSNVVTIDSRLALPVVQALVSTSLDGAVALTWSDDPFEAEPAAFQSYRVYGTSYDLDANRCGATWSLEGTTVAPEFIVSALANGVPRCFAVSSVSVEGYESLWSPLRNDTPRFDARNLVVWARQADPLRSGFRFWLDANGDRLAQRSELGRVVAGASPDADFSVERDVAGNLFLQPQRAGARMTLYQNGPVADLTSIDLAPLGGYGTAALLAQPLFGYVTEFDGGDGFARYGAVRLSHVGRDFLILDWSFQSDPGNPELRVLGAP